MLLGGAAFLTAEGVNAVAGGRGRVPGVSDPAHAFEAAGLGNKGNGRSGAETNPDECQSRYRAKS